MDVVEGRPALFRRKESWKSALRRQSALMLRFGGIGITVV